MQISANNTEIGTALAHLRQRVDAATVNAGRAPGSVGLVAVSKFHPEASIRAALRAGQCVFGENRVQEAAAKFPALRAEFAALELRLIGPLQTNKARAAVAVAEVIETLDRPRLADALEQAAQQEGKLPRLLVQVNVGDEPQKGGISRAEADRFIAAMLQRFGAALEGLMCIPPAEADPAPHFLWLAECARRHGLGALSMGMSGDFESAIACGATHVRIGSALFGARPSGGAGAASPTL
jgi:pyridoxal phosphate enzyme (YggS family)